MMVSILFFFFFLAVVATYCSFPTYNKRLKIYVLFGIGLILVAIFKDGSNMPDYQEFIDNIEGNIVADINIKEPAFFAIKWLADFCPDYRVLIGLFLYAIFGVTLKLIAIKQLTEFWFIALAVFISHYYMLHDLIQIRAGVASAFLLLCIKPLYERNGKRFLLWTLIAFLFHYSAIIIFFLWFLSPKFFKKGIWLSIIPIAYILYFIGFDIISLLTYIPIPGVQTKLIGYQRITELGLNGWDTFDPFAITYLVKIFVLYFIVLNINKIQQHNKYTYILTKIYALAFAVYLLLGCVPVVAYRTKELLAIVEIVLLPSIAYIGVPRSVTKAVPLTFSLLIMVLLIFNSKLLNADA